MDERVQFAALVMASQMGLVRNEDVIANADEQIIAAEKPDYWLIEVSTQGQSAELGALIDNADDRVFARFLRMAFQKWLDGAISDTRFAECCRVLWMKAGYRSSWYYDLIWIDDEFDFVSQGVFSKDDSVRKIKEHLEKLLQKLPC